MGLVWGISNVTQGEASDAFLGPREPPAEIRNVRSRDFDKILKSAVSQDLNACDSHAQRAIMLVEIPLADEALRSGAVKEFDQRIQSLEARSRQISAVPTQFVGLVTAVRAGKPARALERASFDLLVMSYDTSPNEAWIVVRRTVVAMPVVFLRPKPIRQRILTEFQQLDQARIC